MVAEAVTFTREIYPLRVSKLVAHKIKVGLTTKPNCYQADHFMQGDTSIYNYRLRVLAHSSVYLSVEEPHRDGLIADDGLIVRFSISDALLSVSSVSQIKRNVSHAPFLVLFFLEILDPHVRYVHAESVIKPHASFLRGPTQCGHA